MHMADLTIETLSGLIDGIYQSACEPSRWQPTLAAIAESVDLTRACIITTDWMAMESVSSVDDPEISEPGLRELTAADPFIRSICMASRGRAVRHEEVPGIEDFRRGELWRTAFRPRDMHKGMVQEVHASESAGWYLSFDRSDRHDDFGDGEIAVIRALTPHLRQAVRIEQRLRGFTGGIESLPFAALLVAPPDRVLAMNAAAERIVAEPGSVFGLKGERFIAAQPSEQREMERLVAAACAASLVGYRGRSDMLLREDGEDGVVRIRFVASVSPFPGAFAYGITVQPCALITLDDPRGAINEDEAAKIGRLLNLTPSQSRLAAVLATGASLKEAAAVRGLRYASARTYIEEIFRRTGTSKQSELVALLKSLHNSPGSPPVP